MLPEEERKKYDFYESLDNMAAILWYSLCLCLFSLVFYLWKMKKPDESDCCSCSESAS